MKRRDAVLEAISLVANLFLDGHTFDKALQEAILLFGLSTEVDRVMVFQNNMISSECLTLHHLYEWYSLSDSDTERPERDLSVTLNEFGSDWRYRMERG